MTIKLSRTQVGMRRNTVWQPDILPPTVGVRVECSDGSVDNLIIDHEKPIKKILEVTEVPFFEKETWTGGEVKHYRVKSLMMLQNDLVFNDHSANPPMKRRKVKKYDNPPPTPGSLVGFMNGTKFFYDGVVFPSTYQTDIGAQIFTWNSEKYITLSTALHLMFNGGENGDPMTISTRNYARTRLSGSFGSFVVCHRPEAVYETLLLVKLLGAVSRRASSMTFVRTSVVDRFITASKNSRGYVLDWSKK